MPHALRDLDGTTIEHKVAHRESADFTGTKAGLGEDPVIGFVWLWRAVDEALHLIERFTRLDRDTIEYRFTIDDPTVWTRPWTAAFPLRHTRDLMYEYACHEGNFRSIEGVLRGARAQERQQR